MKLNIFIHSILRSLVKYNFFSNNILGSLLIKYGNGLMISVINGGEWEKRWTNKKKKKIIIIIINGERRDGGGK